MIQLINTFAVLLINTINADEHHQIDEDERC